MLVSRSFGSILALAVGASVALAACGSDGNKPTDARIDGPPADASCTNYTGEIVDWNSSASKFCGVFKATATVRGQATVANMTNPNGRFTLCLAPSPDPISIDITPSNAASECTGDTKTSYTTGGVLTLQPSLISGGQLASVRLMQDMELMKQYASVGTTFNATSGQVLVHIIGTPSRVKFSSGITLGNCGPNLQFNGTTWERVDTSLSPGTDVLLLNCPLDSAPPVATTIGLDNSNAQPVTVSVDAGKFTYVTIVSP